MNFRVLGFPFDALFSEIHAALEAGLLRVALGMALTIPDQCAALESANAKSSSQKYVAWADTYFVAPGRDHLTSADLYGMRCGMLHQGTVAHRTMGYDRIIWTSPKLGGMILHRCISAFNAGGNEVALLLCVEAFCRELFAAAVTWWAAKRRDPHVIANAPHLLRMQSQVSSHIGGMSVMA